MDIISIDDDKDNNVDVGTFEKIGEDPIAARALQAMQIRTCDKLNLIIDRLAASLASGYRQSEQSEIPDAFNVAAYASIARQRQWEAKECRLLAEDMVIAALKNLENPDWDPADPATSRNNGKGILQLLLQWERDKSSQAAESI